MPKRMLDREALCEPEIVYEADRPWIEPGRYEAYTRRARLYRESRFKRWTVMIVYDVLTPDGVTVIASVPQWMNLGPGDKPKASRLSNYFGEWIRANDGRAPSRGDRMSPRIFERRRCSVQVEDSKPRPHTRGTPAPPYIKYSVVRHVVFWHTEGRTVSETYPLNVQKQRPNRITNSSIQQFKEGTREDAKVEELTANTCQKFPRPEKENGSEMTRTM